MERWSGEIEARHPRMNDLYGLALRDTAKAKGVRLFWQIAQELPVNRATAPICCAPISTRRHRNHCDPPEAEASFPRLGRASFPIRRLFRPVRRLEHDWNRG
jgi:hypothetical protein